MTALAVQHTHRDDQLIKCRGCGMQVVFVVTASGTVLPCGFKPRIDTKRGRVEVACPVCKTRNRYELPTVA